MFRNWASVVFCAVCVIVPAGAQTAGIDFGRDIQPIFRQNCVSCHGPSQALSNFRIDRKSSVFKEGYRRVVPGSSQNSFLYHRLTGTEYGMQMPPTGKLRQEQIDLIKTWIDRGAEWPDALSNEASSEPPNPRAVSAIESLRNGDIKAFLKAVSEDRALLNARGPEGSTPFMYAALYGDAALLQQLLGKGANPNAKNDAGATPLMWAATDVARVRVLIDHGAEVNVVSEDLRTPLMIAAGIPNGRDAVKLLLDHNANVNPTRHPDTESSPLAQAALAADPETMRMLIDHGADVKASAVAAVSVALAQGCQACLDLLIRNGLEKPVYTAALQIAANFSDAATVRMLIDHGAEVDAPDPLGHTALAYAAGSDLVRPEVVKLLLDRGANVNSRSPHRNSVDTGMTVLDIAELRGETPVVNLLLKAGATSAAAPSSTPRPSPADSVRAAIERSLPLLQRADAGFTAKSGCISCHNDSLAAMTVALARSHGFAVDEPSSRRQVGINAANLRHQRDQLHQFTGGGPVTDTFYPHVLAYQLIGLSAEGYRADLDTDAVAMYVKSRQMADGSWPYPTADTRPPLCSDHVTQTALSLRALQLYAPKGHEAEYQEAVSRASAWLAKADTNVTEDYLSKLLGLAWAGRDRAAIAEARKELLALQRPD
ncbi:MAG: ankyrin repeat domain-containing protein, partial [Acidobacteriota bacterium]|nr:ankyrin repeat domain-containing protein [Acidobacteriota bacterium]